MEHGLTEPGPGRKPLNSAESTYKCALALTPEGPHNTQADTLYQRESEVLGTRHPVNRRDESCLIPLTLCPCLLSWTPTVILFFLAPSPQAYWPAWSRLSARHAAGRPPRAPPVSGL